MAESFEAKIDRLVGGAQDAEDRKAASEGATEAAKQRAFEIFEAKAKEVADFLRARGVAPETRKSVALRYETKKKFLSSQVVRIPVYGQPLSGWIPFQASRSVDRGGASYYNDPTWLQGMVMDTDGKLYSFKDDIAMRTTHFDQAVEAIGSTNAFSLDRVDELADFWEDKVTQTTVRVVKGEPYRQPY
jgi:hypothetical protein